MGSFVESQVAWVKDTKHFGPIERDCILGIKKWLKGGVNKAWGSSKPPRSYLIEVLVLDVAKKWLSIGDTTAEKFSGKPVPENDRNRLNLFKRVVQALKELDAHAVQFGTTPLGSIQKPYVLDPVNPANNLLDGMNMSLLALIVDRAQSS